MSLSCLRLIQSIGLCLVQFRDFSVIIYLNTFSVPPSYFSPLEIPMIQMLDYLLYTHMSLMLCSFFSIFSMLFRIGNFMYWIQVHWFSPLSSPFFWIQSLFISLFYIFKVLFCIFFFFIKTFFSFKCVIIACWSIFMIAVLKILVS